MGWFDDDSGKDCRHEKQEKRDGYHVCKDCGAKIDKVGSRDSDYDLFGFANPSKAPGESGGWW